MKKTNLTALVSAIVCMLLTSCLNTRDEQFTITQNYSNYINQTIDHSTGDIREFTGVGYTIVYNYGNETANVSITGLRLPDGTLYPTLTFSKVPYFINKAGWREIVLTNATPEGTGGFVQAPVFNSLVIKVIDRVAGQYSIPSLTSIKYIVGDCEIFSVPSQLVFAGSTTVTSADGSVYTPGKDEPTTYGINLDPTKHTAMITIAAAKFASNMPAQNIRFKDVPYQITAEGAVVFDRGEQFTPYMLSGNSSSTATETPYPSFPISDLVGRYTPDRGFYLDYTCTMLKNETPVASYKVRLVDEFPTESAL